MKDFVAQAAEARVLGVDKIPAVAVPGAGRNDYGIRFYGVAAGYEFVSLLESIELRPRPHDPRLATKHGVSRVPHTVTGGSPQAMLSACPEPAALVPVLAALAGALRSLPREFKLRRIFRIELGLGRAVETSSTDGT